MSVVEHAVHVAHDCETVAHMRAKERRQEDHDEGVNVVRHRLFHQLAAVELPRAVFVAVFGGTELSTRGTTVA